MQSSLGGCIGCGRDSPQAQGDRRYSVVCEGLCCELVGSDSRCLQPTGLRAEAKSGPVLLTRQRSQEKADGQGLAQA